MNLAIDIGNTRTKIGWFKNNQFKKVLVENHINDFNFKDLIHSTQTSKIIVSSTKHISVKWLNTLSKLATVLVLDINTKLPFKNLYATPHSLGYDRIALIAAAHNEYPNQNTLVIGCGTCITYNFINSKNQFVGGSIHPGLKMRLKAMHHFTQKLPLVELQKTKKIYGNTTESNLLVGSSLATALEIDAMINNYKVNFSKLNVIITGGDADFLVSLLKNKIFVQPNLTLIGLNHILEYNA